MRSSIESEAVANEVEKLSGADERELEDQSQQRVEKRLAWYEANRQRLNIDTSHLPTAGYELLLKKLDVSPEDAPIVERSERRIVFHSKNFCPTLEACKLLGLDTRRVCKLLTERPADALIKQLDGRLQFSRNYERLRPHSEYCEEIITLNE